jgi:hypothetical protein
MTNKLILLLLYLISSYTYSNFGFHPIFKTYNQCTSSAFSEPNKKYKFSRTIEEDNYEHSPFEYDIINYPYYHVEKKPLYVNITLRNCSKNTSRTPAINN